MKNLLLTVDPARVNGAVGILSKSNLTRALLAAHVVQAMKKGDSA